MFFVSNLREHVAHKAPTLPALLNGGGTQCHNAARQASVPNVLRRSRERHKPETRVVSHRLFGSGKQVFITAIPLCRFVGLAQRGLWPVVIRFRASISYHWRNSHVTGMEIT